MAPSAHRGRSWNRPARFSPNTTPDDPLGWRDFRQQHLEQCLIEGPWEAPVDWSDTPDGSDWFFLLGYGRSGTSVLSAMVSEHPEVYCGCEDHTIFSVLGLLCTRWFRTQACDAISYDWHRREPWSGRQLRCFAEAYRQAVELQTGRTIRLIGDKSPHYLERIDTFRRLFPNCRFIYTARHPLDQLASLLNLPPGQSTLQWQGDAHGARRLWEFVDLLGEQLMLMTDAPDVLVLRFEELFAEATMLAAMARAFTHIGADISQAGAEYQMPEDLRERLSPYAQARSPVGRWRHDERVKDLVGAWIASGTVPAEKLSAVVCAQELYVGRMLGAWTAVENRQVSR